MIKVENLYFSYTKTAFIENLSFEVKEGEIFGFLGPSGAGKSTLQKILIGLNPNYKGTAKLFDQECNVHSDSFYENIGVVFEHSTMYEKLTARQNLKFFSLLYKKQVRSIDSLLTEIGLAGDANKKVGEFSKGMKSRVNFIKALIHDPKVLFLDEPTSGLDPTNSRKMKEMILKEKEKGKTILLTTHNMSDAAELCDRVAFIVAGKIAVIDSPKNLIMKDRPTKVKYTYSSKEGEKEAVILLENLVNDEVFNTCIKENCITSIHTSEPNLNDVFIEVTGSELI